MDSSQALDLVVRYGYPTLFIIVAAQNISFLGTFPTSLIAAAMGAVAAEKVFSQYGAMSLLIGASITGDVIAYAIGRYFGRPVLNKFSSRSIFLQGQRFQKVEGAVQRFGPWAVLFSRFIFASLQSIISILSGVLKMQFWHFLLAALVGETIWTLGYFYLGYYSWPAIERLIGSLTSFTLLGAILTITAGYLVWYIYYLRKKKRTSINKAP